MIHKKNILILTSTTTGNGHISIARSLKKTFDTEYPDKYNVIIIDFFEDYSAKILKKAIHSYSGLIRHAPSIYSAGYHVTDSEKRFLPIFAVLKIQTRNKINKLIEEYNPDIVISVHPLLNHVVSKTLNKQNIPFVILITDLLNVYQSWFDKNSTLHIAPTKYVDMECLKHKILNVKTYAIPIDPKFSIRINKNGIYKKYNLSKDKKTILITSGGFGTIKAKKIIEKFNYLYDKYQIIVVNGQNQKSKESIDKMKKQIKVLNFGFVDNMYELMSISDFAISKAGAITLQELISKGVIPIVIEFINGQEKGNIQYIKKEKIGIVAEQNYFGVIEELVNDPRKIDKIKNNMLKLKDINSRKKIVKEIIKIIN